MADDLTTLTILDEDTLMGELKTRFNQNNIYTYISDILISVNPYQYFPIYTLEEQENYCKLIFRSQLRPHLFAISDAAFENLRRTNVNQVCVVSGESGAGKTEATKQLIKHIAFLSNRNEGLLHEQIVQVNPLLEAFGNARTIINDNSSRFGKFAELSFSSGGKILGGKIFEYLLEKSRVVSRGLGEKNFHVFYYMFAGLDDECLRANLLSRPENHRILATSDGQPIFASSKEFNECKENWTSLLEIQKFVGFHDDDINGINAILAAILHIGDIQFTEDEQTDGVYIENDAVISLIGQLLSIKDMDLIDALILNVSTAGSEKVISLKNIIQANAGRDALAKALYGKLFTWIVHKTNKLLQQKSDESAHGWVGVLDIYGFENLAFNSLEQICINLTNEQLQLFFNQHVFRFELEEYEREGINSEMVKFTDNTALVQLILEPRSPPGLFAILDEESTFPQASDLSFVEKMAHHFAGKNNLIQITRPQSLQFVIKHFAVNITYNAAGFLEKNRDILSEDLVGCLSKSQSLILQELLLASASDPKQAEQDTARLRKMFRSSRLLAPNSTLSCTILKSKEMLKKASIKIQSNAVPPTLIKNKTAPLAKSSKTIATHFKNSLFNLVEKMFSAQPHFIRCIKSNKFKMADSFDDVIVKQQLTYTGILETVKIRRQGYPARFPFSELVENFGPIVGIYRVDERSLIDDCQRILRRLDDDFWRLGKSKIFLKHNHLETLNKLLDQCTARIEKCQTFWRAAIARRTFNNLRKEEEKKREEEMSRKLKEENEKRIRQELEEKARLAKEREETEKAKLSTSGSLDEESRILNEFINILEEDKDKVSNEPLRKFQSFKQAQTVAVDTLKASNTSNSEVNNKVVRREVFKKEEVFRSPIIWDKEYSEEYDPTIFMLNESLPRIAQIGSEIWGKLYIIERQTIIGKSYIQSESLYINSNDNLYDGENFGLNHEDLPHSDDIEVQILLKKIKEGICVSVDESKNIFVRKLSDCTVFIRGLNEPEKFSFPEGAYLHKGEIREDRVRIFDIARFKSKIQRKLLSIAGDSISIEEAYEIGRWAVCGVIFEQPSILKSDTDYAISVNIINISALTTLGKDKVFKEMFSSITDTVRYEQLYTIWKSLDIHKMSHIKL